MIIITRIIDGLPEDMPGLTREAHQGGHRTAAAMEARWWSGEERFCKPGEALFGCFADGIFAGIGGVTRDPTRRRPASCACAGCMCASNSAAPAPAARWLAR